VIPGPGPSKGHARPRAGRDRGTDVVLPSSPDTSPEVTDVNPGPEPSGASGACPTTGLVALTRTARGWTVNFPAGTEAAGDLVEGLSLADLVAEELGVLIEPDRAARRSARGPADAAAQALDPAEARVAELERTVAQLEHALAARVSTERALGVLAERHGTSARAAFESLRRDARSQGRPVAELAREVLDTLAADPAAPAAQAAPAPAAGDDPGKPSGRSVAAPCRRRPGVIVAVITRPLPRIPSGPSAVAAADGAS
jgi:ANTAR domain